MIDAKKTKRSIEYINKSLNEISNSLNKGADELDHIQKILGRRHDHEDPKNGNLLCVRFGPNKFYISIKENNTLEQLKKYIYLVTNLPPKKQFLFLDKEELKDDSMIISRLFVHGSDVMLKFGTGYVLGRDFADIQFVHKLNNKHILMKVDLNNTIHNIKQSLEKEFDFKQETQVFVYDGIKLNDRLKFLDYGLSSNDNIYVYGNGETANVYDTQNIDVLNLNIKYGDFSSKVRIGKFDTIKRLRIVCASKFGCPVMAQVLSINNAHMDSDVVSRFMEDGDELVLTTPNTKQATDTKKSSTSTRKQMALHPVSDPTNQNTSITPIMPVFKSNGSVNSSRMVDEENQFAAKPVPSNDHVLFNVDSMIRKCSSTVLPHIQKKDLSLIDTVKCISEIYDTIDDIIKTAVVGYGFNALVHWLTLDAIYQEFLLNRIKDKMEERIRYAIGRHTKDTHIVDIMSSFAVKCMVLAGFSSHIRMIHSGSVSFETPKRNDTETAVEKKIRYVRFGDMFDESAMCVLRPVIRLSGDVYSKGIVGIIAQDLL